MLPRELGRLERRTLVSVEAIAAIALVAIGIVLAVGIFAGDDPVVLASAYRSACSLPSRRRSLR